MKAVAMKRQFSFAGLKLPDPDPRMSVEEVRGVLALQYPEIATATVTGPEAIGETLKYTSNARSGRRGNRETNEVRRDSRERDRATRFNCRR